jgi:hypothetical protein
MLAGNYYDVATFAGRLLALNHDTHQLEIIDPSLAILNRVPLPDTPRRLVVSQKFPFDANGDGTLQPGESIDAAFIGGEHNVVMVDITNLNSPRVVGRVAVPDWITDLDVDRQHRRIAAVTPNQRLYLIDVSRIQSGVVTDNNGDGIDDRIVFVRAMVSYPWSVRFDPDRPYMYVATDKGLEAYGFGPPSLHGTADYTYFPVNDAGVRYIDPGCPTCDPRMKPIRGATVELWTDAGEFLQSTTTNEAGYYAFDAPQGIDLKVKVKAALGPTDAPEVEVFDNT